MSEEDFEPIRTDLIVRHGLSDGDNVLEIGCATGVNVRPFRDRIRGDGNLVATDYSPDMIANARELIATNGWDCRLCSFST